VHPSCVHVASIAVNAVALVRESRNTPAMDWINAAPPASASGEPATLTCTAEPAKRPDRTASIEPMPLGDVGDPPPQAGNNVAIVAPDAT
jgi:hypothetical protein